MGAEDFYGDMDFKIAGTKEGITAAQLDIKVETTILVSLFDLFYFIFYFILFWTNIVQLTGVPLHILCEGVESSKNTRNTILDIMKQSNPCFIIII